MSSGAAVTKASRAYTIRSGRGGAVGTSEMTRHYVAVFHSPLTARKVMYSIGPTPPQLSIKRGSLSSFNQSTDMSHSISGIVEDFLEASKNTLIDVSARVVVKKGACRFGAAELADRDNAYRISEAAMADIVALPSSRGVGVILAYALEDESDKEMSFAACVIEPCIEVDRFRRTLAGST
jgi:hypothetical protein